ncbi:MAG TPA: hypothetical protein GX743_07690 [Actinomycetales bacterium]|nr:hypothetical protein [Actinomycetales bacterium]
MTAMDPIEVWNRATDYMADGLPEDAGFGDRHLVQALSVDGAIQANGVEQVFETHDVDESLTAFRWFGLDDVAEFLERAAAEGAGADEEWDEEASGEYYDLEVDSRLSDALEEKLTTDPEAFLPL